MKVKGTKNASMLKVSYLQTFNLTEDEICTLKKGKEIELKNADALLQAGFVEVVKAPKPEPIKVKVEQPMTKPIKSIVPKMDEEV